MNKSSKAQQQQLTLIGIVAAAAVAVFVVVILLGSQGDTVERTGIAVEASDGSQQEDGVFVMGDPDAPVTIVEFADFRCPFCQDYKPTVDQIIEELVNTGEARFEFRTFVATNPESEAVYYANLLQCAGDLGGAEAYWAAYEELFVYASEGMRGNQAGRELANSDNGIDVDYGDLLECVADADQVEDNMRYGASLGVRATPTVLVRLADGTILPVPGNRTVSDIRAVINSAG